jgi:hypothetical protein
MESCQTTVECGKRVLPRPSAGSGTVLRTANSGNVIDRRTAGAKMQSSLSGGGEAQDGRIHVDTEEITETVG